MFEVIYETAAFNDPSLWPEDGSQPFVYSFGDNTGYANHGDYVFGWKDDSLQKIMDDECFVQCKSMRTQSIEAMNACGVGRILGMRIVSVVIGGWGRDWANVCVQGLQRCQDMDMWNEGAQRI